MNIFGLDAESILQRLKTSPSKQRVPTLSEALVAGGLGFCLVSAIVFTTVAYGERGLYSSLGKIGAYLVWISLFVLGAGYVLGRLVIGPRGLPRFYGFFAVAFLLFSIAWMVSYFSIKSLLGEVIGAVAGGLVFGVMFLAGFDVRKAGAGIVFTVLLGSTAGYLLGRLAWVSIPGKAGMIAWGVVYGLCFGLALAFAVYVSQSAVREALKSSETTAVSAATAAPAAPLEPKP